MQGINLAELSRKDMTRKEFIVFSLLMIATLCGIGGLIAQLSSHAAAPAIPTEPETGILGMMGNASVVSDPTASGSKAVKFSAHTLPTTGDLATRCSFGAYAGSTTAHAALEQTVGAALKNYVMYFNMGYNGSAGWPTAEAD